MWTSQRIGKSLLLLSGVLVIPGLAQTHTRRQTPSTRTAQSGHEQVRYKGIWEPVNYNGDVKFINAFFATAEEGWVAGGADEMHGGIILHTIDGGSHWETQYGDPQSSERAVHGLRFLDAMHGWAVQDTGSAARLLHTTNGTDWVLAGTIPEQAADYMFNSERTGVAVHSGHILQTTDGGRSWHPVADCEATVQVKGLSHRVTCEWTKLQFVSASLAYAVGFNRQARNVVFLARTTDGGATWQIRTGEVADIPQDAFFLDENTGYIRTGVPDTGQIFRTTDGGATWTGMAASPGARMQFADPGVGWAVLYDKVSFTTDGGIHWNSRQYPFPARVNTFSLPRRDRGYVAGDHGMIYRYRLVPETYTSAGMIAAPLLSGIDSPLDDQMLALVNQVQRIAKKAGIPQQQIAAVLNASGDGAANNVSSDSVANSGGVPGTASAETTAGTSPTGTMAFSQGTGAAAGAAGLADGTATSGGFVQDTTQASSTLDGMYSATPQFISKYRNLNLLMVGVQVAAQLPQQLQTLKQSFADLKQLKSPQATTGAVQNILTQVGGLRQSIRLAFQKPQL